MTRHAVPTAVVGTTVLLHLTLLDLGGFPLTVAPFVVLIFLRRLFVIRPGPHVLVMVLVLLTMPLLTAWSTRDQVVVLEFARTYGLWVFAMTAVVLAATAAPRAPRANLATSSLVSLALVSIYSMIQYLMAAVLRSDLLYNPWGDRSYLGGYQVFLRGPEVRAAGLYLEPSFNALVIITLIVVVLLKGSSRQAITALLVAAPGLFVTRSLAGFVTFGIVVVVLSRQSVLRRWPGSLLTSGAVAVALILLTDTGSYIQRRVESASVEGSSTSYRLVQPLRVLWDVLLERPIGQPLGSIEVTLERYGLANGALRGTSLDNGLYLVIYYTGWVGVLALVALCGAAVILGLTRGLPHSGLVPGLLLLLVSLFTGGVLLPETVLIMIVLLWAWRTRGREPNEPAAAEHRHGDLPRPGRPASHSRQSAEATTAGGGVGGGRRRFGP